MGKKAVVLCGGGAKGAYHIGAWKALKKLGFYPDIVTGTSVGALNGAFMVMDDYNKAKDIWSNIDMKQIFSFKDTDITKAKSMVELTKMLISQGESASYEPLLKLIDENIDENKIRKSKIDFGFVTTQFLPLKKVEIYKEDIEEGKLNDYIMASAACYPYMKSYSIGKKTFIDGGYFDNMPIEMAIKKGAADIVVVDLKAFGKTSKYLDLPAKITYVGSNHNLGGLMIFDKDNSIKNIKLGYLDTMKAFNQLEGDLYTFKKGSNIKSSKYENDLEDTYKKIFSNLPSIGQVESLAKKSLQDHLDKYNRELFTINSNVLTSLEFASYIFKMDILKTYTFNSLSKKLVKKVKRHSLNNDYKDILNLKTTISSILDPNKIKDITNTFDKKNLICYIVNILKKDILSYSEKMEIWTFSVIVPDVVLGTIFISAYMNRKRLQLL